MVKGVFIGVGKEGNVRILKMRRTTSGNPTGDELTVTESLVTAVVPKSEWKDHPYPSGEFIIEVTGGKVTQFKKI